MAAGGEGGWIYVWDLSNSAKAKWVFQAPDLPTRSHNHIHALAFVANDTEVVAAYEWGGLRIWNLQSRQSRPVSGWPQPSEYTLKTSTDWDGPDAEPPERRGERPVTALVSTMTESHVVAGDFSGRLFVVNAARGAVDRQIQSTLSGIQAITLLEHENILIAADGGGKLEGYALASGAQVEFSKQPHHAAMVLLASDPNTSRLLSLDATDKLVWWTHHGMQFIEDREVRGSQSPLAAELGAPGILYITTRAGPFQRLSAENGMELGDTLNGHRLAVLTVRCTPAGDRCASGGLDGEVILWNTRQWHPLVAPAIVMYRASRSRPTAPTLYPPPPTVR